MSVPANRVPALSPTPPKYGGVKLFQPGVSGNPNGRPKSFGTLIREQTRDGQTLVDFAMAVLQGQHGAKVEQRLTALQWLADRGWGKPLQVTEIEGRIRIKLSWDPDADD